MYPNVSEYVKTSPKKARGNERKRENAKKDGTKSSEKASALPVPCQSRFLVPSSFAFKDGPRMDPNSAPKSTSSRTRIGSEAFFGLFTAHSRPCGGAHGACAPAWNYHL